MEDSQDQGQPLISEDDYRGFIVFVHQAAGLVRGKKTLCQWLEGSLKLLKIKSNTLSIDTLMKESTTNSTIRSKSKKKNPKIIIRALKSSLIKNQPILASLLNPSVQPPVNPVKEAAAAAAKPQKTTYSRSRQVKTTLNNKTSGQNPPQNWSKMGAGVGQSQPVILPIDTNCVHLGVFKAHLKQMGILEEFCWVLIVESHYKLVMDMDELEELGQEFSFKPFWISAYSKQSTEHCIFDIVNEIFVYKNELLRKKLEALRALNPADIMFISSNLSSKMSTAVQSKQPSSRKFSRSRSKSRSTMKKVKVDSQVQLEASEFASKARLKFGKNVSVPKWTSLAQCTGTGNNSGSQSNGKNLRTVFNNDDTDTSDFESEANPEFGQGSTTAAQNDLINCLEKLKLIDGVGGSGGVGVDSKVILQEMDENLKKRVALLIVQDLLKDQEMNES